MTATARKPVQHTAGPWNLRDTVLGICRLIISVEDMPAIEINAGKSEQVIAYLPNDQGPHEQEQRANARLIAAAPELLEALERVRSQVKDMNGLNRSYLPLTIAVNEAFKVIRKAKGEL